MDAVENNYGDAAAPYMAAQLQRDSRNQHAKNYGTENPRGPAP